MNSAACAMLALDASETLYPAVVLVALSTGCVPSKRRTRKRKSTNSMMTLALEAAAVWVPPFPLAASVARSADLEAFFSKSFKRKVPIQVLLLVLRL